MYSIVPVWPVRSLFPLSISSEVPKSEIIALGLAQGVSFAELVGSLAHISLPSSQ
jgi:hypothetical protein